VLLINLIFNMNMTLEVLVGATLIVFLITMLMLSFKNYHFYDVVNDEIREKYKVNMIR